MKKETEEIFFVSSAEDTEHLITAMLSNVELNQEIFRKATEVLDDFCITANLKGKPYLRYALLQVVIDETLIYNMTKGLYVNVSEAFDVTVSKVERCMRFAIQTGWDRSATEVKEKYFGAMADLFTAPTVSEFVANVAERIRFEITGYQEKKIKTALK